MRSVVLADQVDWAGWRAGARALALEAVPPDEVVWSVAGNSDLFGADAAPAPAATGAFTLPRPLVELAETVILAHDPQRFALLYRLIWRAHRGEKQLLDDAADPEVLRAMRLAGAVDRDMHKMRAFLRFREVPEADGIRHLAWFEPEHYIVEANAPFFVRRFATMRWSILTPYRGAHWDGTALAFGPGASRADIPADDALAEYWRTYFTSIFNPARLKVAAMTKEMPRRYWRNLPEAEAIPELIRTAPARAVRMVEQELTSPPRPVRRPPPGQLTGQPAVQADTPLARARAEAATCRACPLYANATQTVFGEGPSDARIMLVGEQPGDQEDLAGRPFVGPAGQMLDRALAEAGLDRSRVYVTNAVKHFKFEPRGKRRIHAKPDAGEIAACRFWLDLERRAVQPAITVLLGASAARSVLGRIVTISRERGQPIPMEGNARAFVTVHPSYLLRLPDEASRAREYAAFVVDLRKVVELAA